MLDTIYIGMSGLTSFSKGLSNISNNVANLNTTGFKGSDLQFSDLFYRNQYTGSDRFGVSNLSKGMGVETSLSTIDFSDGDFRQTGNSLDAAIQGSGFFALKKDDNILYTRQGQFAIDNDGYLVSSTDQARVLSGVNGGGRTINISGQRSVSAEPTTLVEFNNTLSVSSPNYELTNVNVIDSLGTSRQLTLNFENNTDVEAGQWIVTVSEGDTELASGNIQYSGSGDAISGESVIEFLYSPSGATATQLTLDFSDTNFLSSSSSSVAVASQNGKSAGFLTQTSLDREGYLVLTYSNGDTVKHDRLALVNFENLSVLKSVGGNRFEQFGDSNIIVGGAGERSFGFLQTSGIELSNVDLASEFSELIIVQRAYQASSQVVSAANEMIQQLAELKGRR